MIRDGDRILLGMSGGKESLSVKPRPERDA
jgi:tRNA(Ile)-lysidine synthase TilS/MesJ